MGSGCAQQASVGDQSQLTGSCAVLLFQIRALPSTRFLSGCYLHGPAGQPNPYATEHVSWSLKHLDVEEECSRRRHQLRNGVRAQSGAVCAFLASQRARKWGAFQGMIDYRRAVDGV